MLDEALEYLEKRRKSSIGTKRKDAGGLNGSARANGDASHDVVVPGSYEVLIVDDGSKDGTPKLALEYAKKNVGKGGEFIKVVKLEKNRGKGGAVRHVSSMAVTFGSLVNPARAEFALDLYFPCRVRRACYIVRAKGSCLSTPTELPSSRILVSWRKRWTGPVGARRARRSIQWWWGAGHTS